ncbi:MAG TPA: aspartate-semialdehyde dehydrogenase [Candidatus Kapabacteria bacterium]|nr:aspartate-semialdehyde dehydrogenase [Candidatus Kapabacteria bacterium]
MSPFLTLNSSLNKYSIGIIGATGAVGTELLRVLDARDFPISELHLFASDRSAGKQIEFRGTPITLEKLGNESFEHLDLALFSAGSEISKQWRGAVERAGCIMIDNSSAFRMEQGVPLVIPEINAEDLKEHRGVIAVPNCSTIVMLMAVAPLRAFGKIKRIVVSTYQAVSGAGAKAMQELESQAHEYLHGRPFQPSVFPHPIAFNLFCHNTAINEAGYNAEEWKMIQETKKILHDENILVTATCVRVPVFRAHSESINIEFENGRPSIEEIRSALALFPGVKVVDDRAQNHFPMPNEATGQFDVLAGHIRHDVSNPRAVDLFVSGDQLLKGAALDAVQIADSLIEQGLIRSSHA